MRSEAVVFSTKLNPDYPQTSFYTDVSSLHMYAYMYIYVYLGRRTLADNLWRCRHPNYRRSKCRHSRYNLGNLKHTFNTMPDNPPQVFANVALCRWLKMVRLSTIWMSTFWKREIWIWEKENGTNVLMTVFESTNAKFLCPTWNWFYWSKWHRRKQQQNDLQDFFLKSEKFIFFNSN
jgi:hypothetical protein